MKRFQKFSLGAAIFFLSAFSNPSTLQTEPTNYANQVKSKIAPFQRGEQIKYTK